MVQKTTLSERENLIKKLLQYCEGLGYRLEAQAILPGSSGLSHKFDILASWDDAIISDTIAMFITPYGGDVIIEDVTENDDDRSNGEANTVAALISSARKRDLLVEAFEFANAAYDVGILHRIIVTSKTLSAKERELISRQRIRIINASALDNAPPQIVHKAQDEELRACKSRAEFANYLKRLGYRVEEGGVVPGRSGLEYLIDIIAYRGDLFADHSIGIEVMESEDECSLEQISLFDNKAYDVGLDHKLVVLIDTRISPKARQFASHRGIKILELSSPKEAPPPPPEGKKPLRQLIQHEAVELIPEVLARRYQAIPVDLKGNTLEVAMADPNNILAVEAFSLQTKKRIKVITASAAEIMDAIDSSYKGFSDIERFIERAAPQMLTGAGRQIAPIIDASDTPLAQAADLLIEEAAKARASDIHIEPEEKRLRVRYRIDGILHDVMSMPLDIHLPLISRIKIMANMNIADRLRPQDGQITASVDGRKLDIRVASIPTVTGEMAVLRLLDTQRGLLKLDALGLLPDSLEMLERMLRVPYGMILLSGPTGAGKTTTLYAAINSLDTRGRNIITVEDPVEYRFKDINQVQVNPQAGITFASGLRSILRLDPDVILVGEIRDKETADIAVQAALTGHLMLSSIHANNAVGTLFRLVDLGVETFLIASSLIGVVAQRMVRRICPDCAREVEAPPAEQFAYQNVMKEERTRFIYGAGCRTCSYTGYLGRVGIFEILSISDEMRELMAKGASTVAVREQALKDGMVPLVVDGMRKVRQGITTPAEVLRSAYSIEGKV